MNAILARYRLPRPAIVAAIAGAWTLAIVAQAVGRGEEFHHDALLEGGLPVWAALGLFLLAWQAMLAAMMLPSSLPMISLFERTAASQPSAGRVRLAFLGGYAAVWTIFGAFAFAGDALLHEVVHMVPWLEAHPNVIGGSVLVLAGAFQFTPMKDACLDECRHPAAFLMRNYARGAQAAYQLGWKHGKFCLGCCWALMLVSFAVGVANLAWMAVLTLVMVFEKTGKNGDRGVVPIGMAFIGLGVLVLVDPSWLPGGVR